MGVPKWIVYYACHSEKKLKAKPLRVLLHVIDFHPRRRIGFLKSNLRSVITGEDVLVYFHIPKTGGTYLTPLIKGVPFVNLSHSILRDDLSDAHIPLGFAGTRYKPRRNHFLFATVRHPLRLFRSYYHHLLGFGSYHHHEQHYDYANATKGFEYLIKTILDRENVWPSRRFLFPQLFDQRGKLVVSWINRTETLDEDMEALAREKGFEYRRGRPKRVSPGKELGHYFSDSLRETVEKHYAREIALFGYHSDARFSNLVLHRRVDQSGTRYVYISDELSTAEQWMECD